MRKAWCPEKQVEMNPLLEIARYVVFHENKAFKVDRPAKFGGPLEFETYEELESTYGKGSLHPQDLKNAVADELTKTLEPIRKYFETDKDAKECLETVKNAQVTR
jgi:tyrosyl-tRNA synthetase